MLNELGYTTTEELIEDTIPDIIRHKKPLRIGDPISEAELRTRIEEAAAMNGLQKSFIGKFSEKNEFFYNFKNRTWLSQLSLAPILRDVS